MMLSARGPGSCGYKVHRNLGSNGSNQSRAERALIVAISGKGAKLPEVEERIPHELNTFRVKLIRNHTRGPPHVSNQKPTRPHELGGPGQKLRMFRGLAYKGPHPVNCQSYGIHYWEHCGVLPIPQE